ncbi:MAG: Ig-like domain-containing protein, partial [Actinomycetota bacterium]
GTYTVDLVTGKVTFDPEPTFTGEATPVTYQVADEDGVTGESTITITVTPIVPDPANDIASTPNGLPVVIDILGNDAPGDPSAPLDPASVKLLDPADGTYKTSVTVPGVGTYVVDPATGKVTFTPEPGFTGTAPPLTYQVADGNGATATATITVTTSPPPTANADTATTGQNQNVVVNPLANDVPGGAPLDPTTVKLKDPADGVYKTSVTIPGEGIYTVDPVTGKATFDPEPSFTGTTTPLTYQVTDEDGLTTTSTITIGVDEELPVATPNTGTTAQGLPVTLDVLANDTSADGIPLDPATVKLKDPTTGDLVTTLTIPGEGTYRVDPTTGKITFDPDPTFTGKASPVSYVVEDDLGRSVESTLTITVEPNRLARNDSQEGRAGEPIVINVLGNDTIVPGVPLDPDTLRLVDPRTGELVTTVVVPGEGVWTVDRENGVVVFLPEEGFEGKVTPIIYSIEDVEGRVATAKIEVTVLEVAIGRPDPSKPEQQGGSLPRTGMEIVGIGMGAVVLLAVGVMLVVGTRRRRETH